MRSSVGRVSLAGIVAAFALALFLLPATVAAAAHKTLPIKICLKQPKTVQVNGQDVLTCPSTLTTVPRNKVFYLLVSVTAAKGFQTYGLDWSLRRWQPRRHRWATVRRQAGTKIQPDWQYVWLVERGLAPGNYRAFVSSDFLAKYTDAPMFYFAASFKVR